MSIYHNNFNYFKERYQKNLEKLSRADRSLQNVDREEYFDSRTEFDYFPWSLRFSSPIFHVQLSSIKKIEQINAFPYVLVRDGLAKLVDFFLRFPTPQDIRTTLLVHETFIRFVPPEWESKVLFFDYTCRRENIWPGISNASKKLIVKGLLSDRIFNEELFKKQIINSCKSGIDEILFYVIPGMTTVDNADQYEETNIRKFDSFAKFLYREIPSEVSLSFLTWKNLLRINARDMHFLDINQKSGLYVDDFTNLLLIEKGAIPYNLKTKKINEKDLVIKLGSHYSVNVIAEPDVSSMENFFEKIKSTLQDFNYVPGDSDNKGTEFYLVELAKTLPQVEVIKYE